MKEVIWKPGHGSRDLNSCSTILVNALILFSRFFACNLNLPEIWSERYFFSWREPTRLFLKSQGRVPRTSEMNLFFAFPEGPAQTRTNQKAGGSGKASPSQNTSCVVRGVCAGAVKQRTLTSAGIRSPCRRLFSRPKLRCWKGRRAVVLAFFGIRRKFSKFMLLLKL